MLYDLKKRIIAGLNNNEPRIPWLRGIINRAVDVREFPWFFLKSPPRCYIRPGLGVEQFFKTLRKREVQYVVLRWFDVLPQVQEGEDIDLLVRDCHLVRIADLITKTRGSHALDIYTTGGSYQKTFRGQPYFPRWISEEILTNRVLLKEHYFAPDDKSYFLSLLYHLVFHKGEKYFEVECGSFQGNGDHDYQSLLENLALKLSIPLPHHSADCYFKTLQDHDWSPPIDHLRFLAGKQPWLRRFIEQQHSLQGEAVLFMVRQWAVHHRKVDFIIDAIERRHEILAVHKMKPDESRVARDRCRGGNWSRGPYIVNGGDPAVLVVAFDDRPRRPDPDKQRTHPHIQNRNIFVKDEIREAINNNLPFFKRCNPLHSTDDEHEAMQVLASVNTSLYSRVKAELQKRRILRSRHCGIKIKSNRRATVEILTDPSQQCIKKSFRDKYSWHFNNELFAHTTMAEQLGHIPRMIETGPNYIITERIDNILTMASPREKAALLSDHGATIVNFLNGVYELGFALIDFKPDNVLIDPHNKVFFVDFEFLHKYEQKPDTFRESYDIVGLPSEARFPVPEKLVHPGRTWQKTWAPLLGRLEWYWPSVA